VNVDIPFFLTVKRISSYRYAGGAAGSPMAARALRPNETILSDDAAAGSPAAHRRDMNTATAMGSVGKVKAPTTPISALCILKYGG
jgi:hypothetical protein